MVKHKKNIQSYSIRFVFTMTMVGISVLSFIIIAFSFTRYANGVIRDDVLARSEQNMVSLARNIEDEIHREMKLTDMFYHQVIKKNDIKHQKFDDEMSFLYNCHLNQIDHMAVIGQNGTVYWSSHELKNKVKTTKQDWFLQSLKQIDQVVCVSPTFQSQFVDSNLRKSLLISRYVELKHEGKVEPGVLIMELNFDIIEGMLESHNQGDYNYFYIVDQDGHYVYHPHIKAIESGFNVVDSQEEYNVMEQTLGYIGWQLYSMTSLQTIVDSFYELRWYIWSGIFLFTLFVSLIEYFIVKKITKPISNLAHTVEEFGEGKLDIRASTDGVREVSSLAIKFNQMAISIQSFMKNIFRQEEEKWETELKILQSQINPHFLYNTLDSLIWMIQSQQIDSSLDMVSSLAKFYRISLNKGNDIITLKKELEHGESYLKIQNIRFQDRFTYLVNTDPSLYQYVCPKIILQPLIENAVYHGMNSMSGEGEVVINMYDEGEMIVLEVCDNGEGMSEEQIYHVMHEKVVSSAHGSGIGVRNVDQRLKLCFGKQYGIEIESEIDEGTIVRIRIPKVVNIDEYHKKEDYYMFDYFDSNSSKH